MDTLSNKILSYQKVITCFLQELADDHEHAAHTELEYQVISDVEHGHFQFTRVGWLDRKFHFLVLIHLDLKPDGKIWVQQNNTEIDLGVELETRGVAVTDIVVGFRPAYMRPGTGYATA